MSNTASLELSRELFELSGWGNNGANRDLSLQWYEPRGDTASPLFDAGYLLRKLPTYTSVKSLKGDVSWMASYDNGISTRNCLADNPEDCLARLCITLIKAYILPISGRDL